LRLVPFLRKPLLWRRVQTKRCPPPVSEWTSLLLSCAVKLHPSEVKCPATVTIVQALSMYHLAGRLEAMGAAGYRERVLTFVMGTTYCLWLMHNLSSSNAYHGESCSIRANSRHKAFLMVPSLQRDYAKL
jgi:hypothetical protein